MEGPSRLRTGTWPLDERDVNLATRSCRTTVQTAAVVGRRRRTGPATVRISRPRRKACRFAEDSCLRCSDAVTSRPCKTSGKLVRGQRVHRYLPVHGQPGVDDHSGGVVDRTPRKRSYGSSPPPLSSADLAIRVQGADELPRVPPMPRSANAASTASEACGDGGIGTPKGITSETCDEPSRPRAWRNSCVSRAVSLGAGGHLNGVDVTRSAPALREPIEHLAQGEGTRDRVELVPAFDEPRSRTRIDVGAESDHQDVRVEGGAVGLSLAWPPDPASGPLLHEANSRPDKVNVTMHARGRRSPC